MSASYSYDPLGRRVLKTVNGTTTAFASFGQQEIAEYQGTASSLAFTRRFIYGPGLDEPVAAVNATGARSYQFQDALGSVILTANAAGQMTEKYAYSAYGMTIATGAGSAAYRFTGRRYDDETGLYFYRNRAYSPALGRFLQTDPVGTNLYAYVNNDPLNLVDPRGLAADAIKTAATDFFNLSILKPASDIGGYAQDLVSDPGYFLHAIGPTIAGVGMSAPIAGGGTVGAGTVGAAGAAAADAQAAGATRGVAAALEAEGNVFTDISSGAARQLGQTPTPVNPTIQNLINSFEKNSPFAGSCAEIACVSQALNAGVNPSGGTISTAAIRAAGNTAQGAAVAPCVTCAQVLRYFGIKVAQ